MNPRTGHIVADINDINEFMRKDYVQVDEEYQDITLKALAGKKEVYVNPKSKEFKHMTEDMKTRLYAKLIDEMKDYPDGLRMLNGGNLKEKRIKELLGKGFKIQAIYEKLKKEGY